MVIIIASNNKISIRNDYFVIRMIIIYKAVKSGIIKLKYTLSSEVITDSCMKVLLLIKYTNF